MKLRWILLVALVAGLAAGSWWFARSPGTADVPTETAGAAAAGPPESPPVGAQPATNDETETPDESAGGADADGIPVEDQVAIQIGKSAHEVDTAIPPFFVVQQVMKDYLAQDDRVEYDLYEIRVFVQNLETRYLAVGKVFRNDIEKIPSEVKSKLLPWKGAGYVGDFEPYRLYKLEE